MVEENTLTTNTQEKKMTTTMTRIDVKMMDSKELRELQGYVTDELNFRASIGKGLDELHDENVWLSAEDWSTRVSESLKEEDDRKMPEQS